MKITRGLLPRQIVQRDGKNRGTIRFGGTCKADGDIRIRAVGKAGLDWKSAGNANHGEWTAELSGLRTGGPYRIEAEILSAGRTIEKIAVADILVGDLWVLAGQSNME